MPTLDKTSVQSIPVLNNFFVENNLKIENVVCDSYHTIVQTKGGKLFSFGNGKYDKYKFLGSLFARTLCLGHPNSQNLDSPHMIRKLKDTVVRSISTNKHSSLAIDKNNKLFVWGRGEFGVNGMGNSKSIQTPEENLIISSIIKYLGGANINKIVSCSDFSSVLFNNGDVYSFGNNDQGVMSLENSSGVDMTETIAIPQKMNRKVIRIDGEKTKITDIELGELFSIIRAETKNGSKKSLFWSGRKLSHQTVPIQFDFEIDHPRLIAASDKGYAFVTESNK